MKKFFETLYNIITFPFYFIIALICKSYTVTLDYGNGEIYTLRKEGISKKSVLKKVNAIVRTQEPETITCKCDGILLFNI